MVGSGSRVVLVRENGRSKIIKRLEIEPDAVRTFMRDVRDYHQQLRDVIQTPKIENIAATRGQFVEIMQEYVPGLTLKEKLETGQAIDALETFRKSLLVLMPVIGQRSRLYKKSTGVPIDSHPENFIETPSGKIYYVDVTPPIRISRDGRVSLWESRRIHDIKEFVFRRTQPKGILQNLLFQSVRIRPNLRYRFENEMLRFLDRNGFGEEALHIRRYIKTKKYKENISKYRLAGRVSNSAQVKRTINPLQ